MKTHKKISIILLLAFLGGSAYLVDYGSQSRGIEPPTAACESKKEVFEEQTYLISLCALDGSAEYRDMRLQVFSGDKELLAERFFKAYTASRGTDYHYKPEKKAILYYDDYHDQEERYISIPPTRLDWIRARLP